MKTLAHILVIVSIFLLLSLTALSSKTNLISSKSADDSSGDYSAFFDANNILMFTTNVGTIGTDHLLAFGRNDGFYYPYTGDTSDLGYGNGSGTLLYGAGLVLTGKVDGTIRTAVTLNTLSEFVPGPISKEPLLPDQSFFKVFKIDGFSQPGDYNYDNWPIPYGAPIDSAGNPLLLGSQTLWTVFNEADTAAHNNLMVGNTAPLGVEIQQTVWGSDNPDEENVLYLKYKLYNRGSNIIDSFYISFWADPDIGGPNDDLSGCDSANNLFFCYNASDYDNVYGSVPPAWGGKVVSGPVVESPDDTALFDGNHMPDHKNIGMCSFIHYINGTAPGSPDELFECAKGWDCIIHEPQINPVSGDTTAFFASGDPLSRVAWVDTSPADQRLMVNLGPLTFNPDDSQQVVLKLGAFAEIDRLMSLSYLRHILDPDIPVDTIVDTILYINADSVDVTVDDHGLSRVRFIPDKENWLTGHNWGGRYFDGGIDYAEEFFGSGLDPVTFPDSFSYVEIRFSNTIRQKAYRYVRGEDPSYGYFGYREVPFTVWDADHNRQLNAAFVEHLGSSVYDSTWGPDIADNNGGYEFLFIFNSDYSGDDPLNSVINYTEYNLIDDADSMDVMYFMWLSLQENCNMDNLKESQQLAIIGQFINQDGLIDSLKFRPTEVGQLSSQEIKIKTYAEGPSMLTLSTSNPGTFVSLSNQIKFVDYPEAKITVQFSPNYEGSYNEYLYITDSISGQLLKTIALIAGTPEATNIISDPILIPDSYALYQNYPNPFNPSTAIQYEIGSRNKVNLSIYNLLGQKVKTLVDEIKPAGKHTVIWDGRTSHGHPVANGIYFYRLQDGDFTQTRKMVLVK